MRSTQITGGRMNGALLYATAVAIWGSTWLVIKFQLGVVPPAVSVVWRFVLAAAILFAFAGVKRLSLNFTPRAHFRLLAQGILLFGANYMCVYIAEQYLTSGLVAVVYSLMVFWLMFGAYAVFGTAMTWVGIFAASIGVSGVILVFWRDVALFSSSRGEIYGLTLAVLGSILSALGNLLAVQNHRKGMSLIPVTGWAMAYGAGFVAVCAALGGQPFVFDWSPAYIASLSYLAVFGSVAAFLAYLTLQNRIGAHRAGYSAVLIPVIALFLSTVFEDLRWNIGIVTGVILCLSGNLLAHVPEARLRRLFMRKSVREM
jgi:drug/metabolite transporter (DMT)-like permease